MDIDEIVAKLLENRGIKTHEQINEFLNPRPPQTIDSPFDSKPAIKLIKSHIKNGNKIAIYGDYDVDGICSTAILWETIYKDYKNVFPHIPHRESEGYGLSTKGIDHCLNEEAKLIIAVDNGIVAHEQIKYCQSKGCDIIVVDHHEPENDLPTPNVLLHSTTACAAGLAWLFARDYTSQANSEQLSLVALATICDLVPLTGLNRSFAKFGLQELQRTSRPGILALYEVARIQPQNLGAYHVGFMLGPRLNSMGRLEHAIDSLRLLCTSNHQKAFELANLLNSTNQQRQTETQFSLNQALGKINKEELPSILLSADVSYHSGVIGLIAAKMVETYWRPSIAVNIGEKLSKGSGRSIAGFHITEFLRSLPELFENIGGHAMACGFTIQTSRLDDLARYLESAKIDDKLLVKQQRVDLEIPLSVVNFELLNRLQEFEPFGLGNPTPIFKSEATITSTRPVGQTNKHLKLSIDGYDAIWFNATSQVSPHTQANITYNLERDIWNGQEKLQLVIKSLT